LEVPVELLGIVLISGCVLAALLVLLDFLELVDLVDGIVRAVAWLIRLVAQVAHQLALVEFLRNGRRNDAGAVGGYNCL
jgi:hypothetical protein